MDILVPILVAFITAVLGPVVVEIFRNFFFKSKKQDVLNQELQLSNIVQDKLLEIQEEIGSDRIWITQFHNGGHFYPTGKSIQKFSMIYEVVSPGTIPTQNNFQNIPINLFSKSINHMLEEEIMCIPDFKDETKPTYGLKYLAEQTGCKSEYGFALKTLNGKLIGIMGIDYVKTRKNLPPDKIAELEYAAAAIGGLLGDSLNKHH
jgi:hypothetical protein